MKPWFRLPERQDALDAAARRWKGTPWRANNASLGEGVGCVELQHELWVELGAIPRLTLPRYEIDHGHHATDPQLLSFLQNAEPLRGLLVFVPINGKLMPGDLIGLNSGRTDHHAAQVIKWDKVVHAVEDHGVIIHGISEEKFLQRALYALRLFEIT
ncbi:hypothetical protein [Oleiharenicola lentus]|uniref:hypothetical protein n=1 Tax=Oleiharenicola lentus TaxID=2508720 RepID=UPI003F660FE9